MAWSARSAAATIQQACQQHAGSHVSLTVGHGGCFACICSVRGAVGHQMVGIRPAPIFDPAPGLPCLKELMVPGGLEPHAQFAEATVIAAAA